MTAVAITEPSSTATGVCPSFPGVHDACACSALRSSEYAYVSPAATMSLKNGQICIQSSGRAERISTSITV